MAEAGPGVGFGVGRHAPGGGEEAEHHVLREAVMAPAISTRGRPGGSQSPPKRSRWAASLLPDDRGEPVLHDPLEHLVAGDDEGGPARPISLTARMG